MIDTIVEILSITDKDVLLDQFTEFETSLRESIRPLRAALRKEILSSEVQKLEAHMSFVEAWREEVCHYLLLVDCFEQHAKSSLFLQSGGKAAGVNEFTRTAYQKTLTAGMSPLSKYLDNLIKCIDSRVNQCKKILGIEGEVGGRRLQGARA